MSKTKHWSTYKSPPKIYGALEYYRRQRKRQAMKPLFLVRAAGFPDIVVRASSPFDALCEAGFWLGADWTELRGAETIWVPEDIKAKFLNLEAKYGYVKRACLLGREYPSPVAK